MAELDSFALELEVTPELGTGVTLATGGVTTGGEVGFVGIGRGVLLDRSLIGAGLVGAHAQTNNPLNKIQASRKICAHCCQIITIYPSINCVAKSNFTLHRPRL